MLRRLPISLRFDDEDSDFYFGFIEQKKNDRELSSLILDLLHVYYENEEVRNIVNDYVIQKSPYMHIHEQLERIALEHSRQSVSANMLNDFTDNARKKVSEPSEPVKEDKPPIKEEPLLLNEAAMDKVIEQKVAEALGRMMLSGAVMPMQDIAKSVTDNVGKTIKEEVSIPTAPKVEKPPFVELSMDDDIPVFVPKSVPPIAKSVPPVSKSVPTAPKIAVESTDSEEDRPKKPASFGKLLGSMK